MKELTIKKRREEIAEVAFRLFAKKGYDKTSLDEIANKLKISKPALYLYFKNKEDLFSFIIESKINATSKKLDEIFFSKKSSIEKLKDVVKFYIQTHISLNEDFIKVVYNAMLKLSETEKSKFKKRLIKCQKPAIEKLHSLIKDCIKEGSIKKSNSLFYVYALLGIIDRPLFSSLFYSKKIFRNSDEYTKLVLDLFLKGASKK